MSNNPPGWYPDPFGRAQVRWWTGSGWGDHVATNGQEFLDAPGAGSVAAAPTAPAPVAGSVAGSVTAPAGAGAPAKAGLTAMQRMAIVGVVALLAGGLAGYLVRGGGEDGGGGGGGAAAEGSLTTPILAGLASLNSYEWQLTAVTVGPTDQDRSEVSGNGASDSAANLRYQKMVTTDTSADDPEPSTGTTESWRTADLACTFDGEEYTSEAANPFEADLGTVLSGIFDIVVPSGNAQMVGNETVAGIDAKHYTFTIEGLGAGTGTQVESNSGELWVAADGNYLLRYKVSATMRSDAEVYSITVDLQLTSVNQPVSIQLPTSCPAPSETSTSG